MPSGWGVVVVPETRGVDFEPAMIVVQGFPMAWEVLVGNHGVVGEPVGERRERRQRSWRDVEDPDQPLKEQQGQSGRCQDEHERRHARHGTGSDERAGARQCLLFRGHQVILVIQVKMSVIPLGGHVTSRKHRRCLSRF